jgi:hypothetical protein
LSCSVVWFGVKDAWSKGAELEWKTEKLETKTKYEIVKELFIRTAPTVRKTMKSINTKRYEVSTIEKVNWKLEKKTENHEMMKSRIVAPTTQIITV